MPSPIKSDELFAGWSRDRWKSLYLFTGTEDFLMEQAIRQASQHWLSDDPSGLNREKLDAETHSLEDIRQALRTLPFLGGIRFVQIDHTGQLSAADQKLLAEEVAALSPETRLILIWGKEWRRDDAGKPLVEAVAEKGEVVIFWPLFPEAAQRWVLQQARQYRKTLSSDAAAWLVQNAGESLRGLDQELAKACLFVGERPALELDDLQASFGYQKASSPFDWINFVRQKRSSGALAVLDRLLDEGEEPIRLLALLSKSLRDWLAAKQSGEPAGVTAMRFHIRRGEENRFAQELARWSEEELESGLEECVSAEHAMKTGRETQEMGLTLLTLSLGRLQMMNAGR